MERATEMGILSRLRLIAIIAAVLAALAIPTVGVAGAASAASGEWETFHEEFSFVEEDGCGVPGLTLESAFVADGREKVTARGPDRLPHSLTFVKLAVTVTNLATGESVTETSNIKVADLKVTDTGDGRLKFISLRLARVVYIQDDRVIARGGVVQRIEGYSDHGGTPTDPSDDEFLEQVIINEVGNPVDHCATVIQAIG